MSDNGVGERGYSGSRSRSPVRQDSRQRGRSRTHSLSPERGNKYAGGGVTGGSSPTRRRARSRSIERSEPRAYNPDTEEGRSPGRGVRHNVGGYSRRPPPPPPPSSFAAPMSRISSSVRDKLKSLYDTDVIREGELDVRALGDLSLLNEEEGLTALDELSKVDLTRIRNISAFFVGICKRTVKRGLHGHGQHYFPRGGGSFRDHNYTSYYDDYQYQDYRRGPPNFRQEFDNYGRGDSYYGSSYDGGPSQVYQRMDYLVLQGKQRDRTRDRVLNRGGYEDMRYGGRRGDYDRGAIMEGDRYRQSSIGGYRAASTHYEDFRYAPRPQRENIVDRDQHYYDDRAVYDSPPRYHR